MRTASDVMQEAVSNLRSYLRHCLDNLDDESAVVPPEGPGRALHLSLVNEVNAALEAISFVEAVVQQKPRNELLLIGDRLQGTLSDWFDSVEQAHRAQKE